MDGIQACWHTFSTSSCIDFHFKTNFNLWDKARTTAYGISDAFGCGFLLQGSRAILEGLI